VIAYDELRKAFEVLAFQAIDMEPDHVSVLAECLVAHMPTARFRDWTRYLEAYENHWTVENGGDVPDSYLDDTLRRLPRYEVREVVKNLMAQDRDELFEALMRHYPALRAVAS
jgi:hypothetical protein